jgi:hypothetical protein
MSATADSAEWKMLTRERASSSSLLANQESMGRAKVELVRAVSLQALQWTVSRQEEKEEREELEEDMIVTHLHANPHNTPHLFTIVRQLNKIKGLSLDSLQARGLHDTVKEITSSLEKFGGYPPPTLSEVEQINSGEPPSEAPSPKMENTSPIPIPPPTAEQYATPSPSSLQSPPKRDLLGW